jgi:hypothetical protein
MSDWRWVKVGTREVLVKDGPDGEEDETTVRRGSSSARFDEETQRSLSIQTGRVIRNLEDLKRHCEINGSRVVERGDHVHAALGESEVTEQVRRMKRNTGRAGGDFPLDFLKRIG